VTSVFSQYARRVEEATPSGRDRYVDFLRALAIGAVVLGHWLAASVHVTDGRLDGVTVLEVADWTHWVTWLFQVMPIFFLVGGYANATSWQRHADTGGGWAAWVHRRSVRLLGPTAVFVGVTVAAVAAARLAGVDPELVDRAGWVSGIMLWFLAVYIAVAALTPLTHNLHRRYGLTATVVLATAVIVGDVARVATSEPSWASANFVLGWALIHQCGYWWRDGALPSGARRALLLSAGGAVALVGFVAWGPWPVSMIDIVGATIQNASPPSLALLALATVQLGVVLAVAEPVRQWLRRPVPWAVVATTNRVVLTLFLWHMVALAAGAAVLYGAGLLPDVEPLSAAWFAWRPVWIVAVAVIAAALTVAFASVEQRTGRSVPVRIDAPGAAGTLAGLGVPVACAGLAVLTIGGLAGDGPLGVPVVGVTAFGSGTLATIVAGRFATQP
jgi:fucose 4-O-acetylase-like acetyltransferase